MPERSVKIFSWALLALLLQFHVRQIVTSSVLYDDAFIATAAKNVAMGPVSAIERAIKRSGEGKFANAIHTDIATAVAAGDTARVRALAATPGLDFTARDREGRTILGIAVKAATGMYATDTSVECVRLLVAAGAKYADDAIEENGRMFSDVVYDSGDRYAGLMDILLSAGAPFAFLRT